ncbi:unnamed protein product [Lampetra planeri]
MQNLQKRGLSGTNYRLSANKRQTPGRSIRRDVGPSEKESEPEQQVESENEGDFGRSHVKWPNRPHLKQVTAGRRAAQSSPRRGPENPRRR